MLEYEDCGYSGTAAGLGVTYRGLSMNPYMNAGPSRVTPSVPIPGNYETRSRVPDPYSGESSIPDLYAAYPSVQPQYDTPEGIVEQYRSSCHWRKKILKS